MKKSTLAALLVVLLLCTGARNASAEVVFEDGFEGMSSWNLGNGAPTTPSGQSGQWSYWERKTCAEMGCSDCAGMPAAAGGYFAYLDTAGGYGGGKAIKFIHSPSCDLSVNQYPASIDWVSPGGYREVYFGYHFKMEATFGSTTDRQCKWLHWIDQGGSSGAAGNGVSNQTWFQMFGMAFGSGDALALYTTAGTLNGGEWWDSGASGTDLRDGNWHWIEWRYKGNTNSSTSDAVITLWIDGVQQNSTTGFKTVSASAGYIYDIKWEMGNCEHEMGSWYMTHTGWKGWWIDNVKISTTYMGPPEGDGGSVRRLNNVTGVRVTIQ